MEDSDILQDHIQHIQSKIDSTDKALLSLQAQKEFEKNMLAYHMHIL